MTSTSQRLWGMRSKLSPTELMARKGSYKVKGGNVATPKVGLSYVLPQSVRISGRRKEKQALAQYITAEEANDYEGENAKTNPKTAVFARL